MGLEKLPNIDYKMMTKKVKEVMQKKGKKAHLLRRLANEITGFDFSESKIRYTRIHKSPMVFKVAQVYRRIDDEILLVNFCENGEYAIYESYSETYLPTDVP